MEILVTLIDWITGEPNDIRSFDSFEEFENFTKGYFENITEIVITTK